MKTYRDHYFLKAKAENYPARSVYKLKEMDAKFKLFKKGMKILDLGAAPGSWSLYAAEKVGPQGFVLGADLQETVTSFPPHVLFLTENVFDRSPAFTSLLGSKGPFHMVMSDMAPSTTGTRFTDQARSLELCMEALEVAKLYLLPGGHFIAKIFMGPDYQTFAGALKPLFNSSKTFKPQSSRAESKEIFVIAMGFKGLPSCEETNPPDTSPSSLSS